MVRPRKSKGMMKPEQAFEQQRAGVVYKIGLRLSTISAVAGRAQSEHRPSAITTYMR